MARARVSPDDFNYGRQDEWSATVKTELVKLAIKDFVTEWLIIIGVVAAITLFGLDAFDIIDLAPGLDEAVEVRGGF